MQIKDHIPTGLRGILGKIRRNSVRIPRYVLAHVGLGTDPNFIIVGAQRSGTTSLYDYLLWHRAISPALQKEVNFFDIHFFKGLRWYQSYFPSKLNFRNTILAGMGLNTITGEASPDYMSNPQVSSRVAEIYPDMKVIMILRNPVDRAYSHFLHETRLGREQLSFRAAIESESERIKSDLERMRIDDEYFGWDFHRYNYLYKGLYVDHINHWLKYFDRNQIYVIRSEDLFEDVPKVMEGVFNFLDLDMKNWISKSNYDIDGGGSYTSMSESDRKWLDNYYQDANHRLSNLLQRDMKWGG